MRRHLSRVTWAAPALMGAAAFFIVVGPGVLRPANIGWLREANADSLTHYLGWAFFRASPWTLPLGANPDYGLELGNSILYSDSIPLLALLFKPLAPWLPPVFQYTGWWLLACFVLQAVFAWLLVGLATDRPGPRLAGAALFVVAPPMLFRLYSHWALVGHWMILAALFLALRPGRQRQARCWVLLCAAASLVHMYLLAIVLAIWLAAWAGDAWCRTRRAAALGLELIVVPACVTLSLWQAGFFLVGSGKDAGGFGEFRLNLNALVNPWGWSRLLPTLPAQPGDYEGFAYLGAGGLLAAIVAVHAAFRLRARGAPTLHRARVPLAIALVVLTVFAASNRVGWGLQSFTYPLPPWAMWAAGLLRSSGRLFWPAFYVLLLAAVRAIVRAYPPRVSGAVLAAALALQALDISAGWTSYGPKFRRRIGIHSPLTSGFWYEAPSIYRRVRLVPPGNQVDNWAVFADYAARHGMATDAVYLARVDRDRAGRFEQDATAGLLDGTRDPESIFILQGEVASWAACAIDSDRDQLASIDGFWVLMPDWRIRQGDRYAGRRRPACPALSAGGEPMVFIQANAAAAAAMVSGWSGREPWGTWSEGRRSTLLFRLEGPVSALEFTVAAATRPGPPLEVEVFVNGGRHDTWRLSGPDRRVQRVTLPPAAADKGKVTIAFAYSDIRSPAEIAGGYDNRRIAMALYAVRAAR